jgi:hypothetical protein
MSFKIVYKMTRNDFRKTHRGENQYSSYHKEIKDRNEGPVYFFIYYYYQANPNYGYEFGISNYYDYYNLLIYESNPTIFNWEGVYINIL